MRLFISLLFATLAFSTFGGNAFADDKDVVDTKKGLTFPKPSGWVVSPPKKGSVAALYAAGDKACQIEFRYTKMESDKAARFFHSFHRSLVGAGLDKVADGESKKYGNLNGKLTEYKVGDDETGKRLFVFEFVARDGAWLVVGMFTAAERDRYFKAYEELLSAVVVAD